MTRAVMVAEIRESVSRCLYGTSEQGGEDGKEGDDCPILDDWSPSKGKKFWCVACPALVTVNVDEEGATALRACECR